MKIFELKKTKLIIPILTCALSFNCMTAFASEYNESIPSTISASELRNSGLIVGPEFGYSTDSYGGADLGKIKKYGNIGSALSWLLSSFIPNKACSEITNKIAAAAALIVNIIPDDYTYVYGTVTKTYQEVHYSDGSFAYFISNYKVSSYLHEKNGKNTYITTEYNSYKGNSPMSLDLENGILK